MRSNLYFSVIVIGIIAVSSCKKLDSGSSVKPSTLTHSSVPDTDVYVSGYVIGPSGRGQIAAYWKNSMLTKLPDSANNAAAESIAVHDSDVLIAATIEHQDNSAYTAVYYRNGHRNVLADKAFVGMSHCAVFSACGCDFYICGAMMINGKYKAVYWKNDVAHLLPSKSPQSFALGITVRDGHVYVAGSEITAVNAKYAVYWDNDTTHILADTTSESEARDIAVIGNDVYAAGYSLSSGSEVATYWKNGTPTLLPDGTQLLSAAASGSDYYFSGSGGTVGPGIYWINNTPHTLTGSAYQPLSDGIDVLGSDVYLAGWTISNLSKVTSAYWKNGNIVSLPTPGQGVGLSIAVVPRSH